MKSNYATIVESNMISISPEPSLGEKIVTKSGLLNNIEVNVGFDTGASKSIIGLQCIRAHGLVITESTLKLKTANGALSPVCGVLEQAKIEVDGYNNNLQQSSVSHGHGFTMSSQATNALETTTDNTSYKSF